MRGYFQSKRLRSNPPRQEVIATGIVGAMAVGFSGPVGAGVDEEGGVAANF